MFSVTGWGQSERYIQLSFDSISWGKSSPTCDDDVDGELDLPVGPGGSDGDVVPRVLLGKELQGASPRRLIRVLQAVPVPAK